MWESKGLNFTIEFKSSSYLNRPLVTLEGRTLSADHAFSACCTMFRKFRTLLSINQLDQLKILLYLDSKFYQVDEHGVFHNLLEAVRFEEEVISEAARIELSNKLTQ